MMHVHPPPEGVTAVAVRVHPPGDSERVFVAHGVFRFRAGRWWRRMDRPGPRARPLLGTVVAWDDGLEGGA
jgi:hypothetical protein